jgi:antitoxin component of RelBE/YafQ-DinJ toxin-antitoxin module
MSSRLIAVKLGTDLDFRVRNVAEELGWTVSQVVRFALEQHLTEISTGKIRLRGTRSTLRRAS